MPTDHGLNAFKPSAPCAKQAPRGAGDRTAAP